MYRSAFPSLAAIAGAQCGVDIEQLVVEANGAWIAVDEEHANLVAQ
ncbi:MAG: hypothetical protein QM736_14515 [Vicinamibacterales bacterium]